MIPVGRHAATYVHEASDLGGRRRGFVDAAAAGCAVARTNHDTVVISSSSMEISYVLYTLSRPVVIHINRRPAEYQLLILDRSWKTRVLTAQPVPSVQCVVEA